MTGTGVLLSTSVKVCSLSNVVAVVHLGDPLNFSSPDKLSKNGWSSTVDRLEEILRDTTFFPSNTETPFEMKLRRELYCSVLHTGLPLRSRDSSFRLQLRHLSVRILTILLFWHLNTRRRGNISRPIGFDMLLFETSSFSSEGREAKPDKVTSSLLVIINSRRLANPKRDMFLHRVL